MKWGNLPLVNDITISSALPSNSYLCSGVYNVNSLLDQLGQTTPDRIAFVRANAHLLWHDTAEGSLPLNNDVLTMPVRADDDNRTIMTRLFCSQIDTGVQPTQTTCRLSFRDQASLSFAETLYAAGYKDGGTGHWYYAIGARLMYNNTFQGVALQVFDVTSDGTSIYLQPAYDTAMSNNFLQSKGYHMSISETDLDLPDDSVPDGYGQTDGEPAHDHTSTTIAVPDAPSVSSHDTGFMHVYKVSTGALATLGQYLFPSAANITDIESALRAIAGIFAYRDSVQYIVDLHAIPVSPATSGSDNIKLGALVTEISQPVCPTDYVDFDCGSISLPLNEQSYLDFLCRAKLFLPFVGFVDINPEYWNGGTLSVKYRFNVIDGSFMAYVSSTSAVSKLANSLIGQYGGSACLHLPVIANSYGSIASGLVGGSMAIAAGAASGNMIGAAASAATALNVQPQMSQSNNYNASTSFLGCRTPYLLIERPVPCMSGKFAHDKGLPLNVALRLSGLRGFTVISDIDLSGITGATDNELDELRRLLSEGVYF